MVRANCGSILRLFWIFLAVTSWILVTPLGATEYIVDSTADAVLLDGQLTLREAVQAADSNLPVGDAPAGEIAPTVDSITFAPELADALIVLELGEFAIHDPLTIRDDNQPPVRIDADEQSRLFHLGEGTGTLHIFNADLFNGYAEYGGCFLIGPGQRLVLEELFMAGCEAERSGGAFYNYGTVELRSCWITGSSAHGSLEDEGGGCLYNDGGTLIMQRTNGLSFMTGNYVTAETASGGNVFNGPGAMIYAEDSYIWEGIAWRAGGIEERSGNDPGVIFVNSSVVSSVSYGDAGGIRITDGAVHLLEGSGVSGNSARGLGIYSGKGAGLLILPGGSLTLDASGVSGNQAEGTGGGIYAENASLIIRNGSRVNNNRSYLGVGGIHLLGGSLSLIGGSGVGGNEGQSVGGVSASGQEIIIENSGVGGNYAAYGTGGMSASGQFVRLINASISSNVARAPDMKSGYLGGLGIGGADVLISGTSISNNRSYGIGGLSISGNARVVDSIISNNDSTAYLAIGTCAGGMHVGESAALELTNVEISGNISDCEGGGIVNRGTVSLVDSLVDGNSSPTRGGGIWSIDGVMSLTRTTVSNNNAPQGGGLFLGYQSELSLDHVQVLGNAATDGGGGFWIDGGGPVTVADSTIDGNSAPRGGGFLITSQAQAVSLQRSAVSRNQASSGDGGGIWIDQGDLEVVNSTVSNNQAAQGGGGLLQGGGSIHLVSATVSANSSAKGGGLTVRAGDALAVSTVLAGNQAAAGSDLLGELQDGGHNFFGSLEGAVLVGSSARPWIGDPLLQPLGDYGGPTQTHLPAGNSPLIDAGVSSGYLFDQRGMARTQDLSTIPDRGDGTDIGSVEVGPEP